jgi:demethylmenaquinone methyltransferase/2-methoxy-6-polyprenyl-1,4-benzoquinol methylase
MNSADPPTHFGFETVTPEEKTRRVRQVFESVAPRYDVMNDLMSLGLHRVWKSFLGAMSPNYPAPRILDLASGTGDLVRVLRHRYGPGVELIASDINPFMLAQGREGRQAHTRSAASLYVQADAEQLPFPSGYFDLVTLAFGLRNMTHPDKALAEIHRVLRTGGMTLILEFSHPRGRVFQQLYDAYSFGILPRLGRWIAQDEASYRYLAESIRRHPDQEALKSMMQESGLARVEYFNLCRGVVALHRGYRL